MENEASALREARGSGAGGLGHVIEMGSSAPLDDVVAVPQGGIGRGQSPRDETGPSPRARRKCAGRRGAQAGEAGVAMSGLGRLFGRGEPGETGRPGGAGPRGRGDRRGRDPGDRLSRKSRPMARQGLLRCQEAPPCQRVPLRVPSFPHPRRAELEAREGT